MPDYANTSGRSGIASYDLFEGSIRITWKSGSSNVYTMAADDLAIASELAQGGSGLNAWLNANGYSGSTAGVGPRRPGGRRLGKVNDPFRSKRNPGWGF